MFFLLIHPATWPQQIRAKNWGGLCPFGGGGAGSPSNTMWSGPRPTCVPSFILIHPTVWPQYTNVTARTDRETGQQSDSIGRTILQLSPKNGLPYAISPKRGQSPQISAHFYCGQTAGCIKMPLSMEVGLSPGHIVFRRGSISPKRHIPNFRPMSVVAKRLYVSGYHLVRR